MKAWFNKFKVLILSFVALALLGTGALVFIFSGVYDIAAATPHALMTRKLLKTVQRNSIQRHARDLRAPELNRVSMIQKGFQLYRRNCVTCHGGPGESRSRVGIGLNPNPPPLITAAETWRPREIAWTIANGLKMAGMPAYILGESPDDIWAMTAFVIRMNKLPVSEYKKMMDWESGQLSEDEVNWLYTADEGWKTLQHKGKAQRGKIELEKHGCVACHEIPGIGASAAHMGPSLRSWSQRHFISGQILNTPFNLVKWLQDPQKIEPQTVMPDLGLTDQQAWDMAAYLYSLGAD